MLNPVLKSLQNTLDQRDITPTILLIPKFKPSTSSILNLVVGYSGSRNSQAVLDIALWISHQIPTLGHHDVAVHVVHVLNTMQPEVIDRADRILWQARCIASEWHSSLSAHLRIGKIESELLTLVDEVDADLMLLGCQNNQHPLVQALAGKITCPILGLPKVRSSGKLLVPSISDVSLDPRRVLKQYLSMA
jgi:nucleotide-binding universal stress UspA family protein